MRFNPDADLDTSRIDWLYTSPNNSPIENAMIAIQPVTERLETMVDYLMSLGMAFFQGAVVMLGVFTLLVIAAQFIDSRR